eukprot:SAG11_NODE_53_length_19648_cov_14.691902_10_plen_334_part_00
MLYINGHAQASGHSNTNVEGCTQASEVLQLTRVETNQKGTAFYPIDGLTSTKQFSVRYQLYTGDGTGADGQCVTLGGNSLGSRTAEDGVEQGLSLCFDEYANNGDHGVTLFWNGDQIWEDRAACGNREGCPPVSYFDDSQWHEVELTVTPTGEGARVEFTLDGHLYLGAGLIERYILPPQSYLGFTARTGGATNNHWVRGTTDNETPRAIRFRTDSDEEQTVPLANFTLTDDATLGGWATNHAGDHCKSQCCCARVTAQSYLYPFSTRLIRLLPLVPPHNKDTGCNWQIVDLIEFSRPGPVVIGVDALVRIDHALVEIPLCVLPFGPYIFAFS